MEKLGNSKEQILANKHFWNLGKFVKLQNLILTNIHSLKVNRLYLQEQSHLSVKSI